MITDHWSVTWPLSTTIQRPDQDTPCHLHLEWSEPFLAQVITNLALFIWSSCTIVIRNLAFLTPLISGHQQIIHNLVILNPFIMWSTRSEDAVLHLWSYLDYHAVYSTVWHNQDQLISMYDDKVSTHISWQIYSRLLISTYASHLKWSLPFSSYLCFSLKMWSLKLSCDWMSSC